MKIVMNNCFGGFGLSDRAEKLYLIRAKATDEAFDFREIPRTDPILIQIVEELGFEANAQCAELGVFDIPDGPYIIDDYDGRETAYIGCTSVVSANDISH